ncbi:hypothetical protein [Fibrella forsythiae]|uniref:Uncharacterized protein n=1 Tax=Fibrella forsythiae TaxID=2817061 RepID=A0ABS3JAI6_9BACT|nr:hypothetical protein [Fibrella forsythiae]MBO0947016.1 hypothetical protein [Fibrella forsythiae]
MSAKYYTVLLLFLTSLAFAESDTLGVGQVVPLLIKQTPNMGIDSVLVSRYDLAKLEFARQTLLTLDFTDTDELISVLKEQAALSMAGREQLINLTSTRLRTLQDSITRQDARIQKLGTLLQHAIGHVNDAGTMLEQTNSSIKTARRKMWWERIGYGLLGTTLGFFGGSTF